MSEPLSSRYDPKSIETTLYREWSERGYFHANANAVRDGERVPYSIVIPPPNVTAELHIGHGLNNTIQDVLIRWQRMQGRETLWLPGTDHAGIATQNIIERQLAQEDKTRYDLGREAFVERVWSWVDETDTEILDQLRSIGASCDWDRTRFTLDPELSTAVREVFVRLYEKGLVYRGNYIINWCPRCLTALSDEEAEPEDTEGKLYHFRYPLTEGSDAEGLPTLPDGRAYLVVATTRPETMLGDTAVAVHPDDERYQALVGAEVELPLVGRTIPVVADEVVDRDFGTGAVKMTPAHDPNDFEFGQRHDLPIINILTPEGTTNDAVPEAFRGLDRFEARKRIVEAFEAAGLLEEIEEHTHAVPHCYRCDTVVEPRLSLQWFVKMKPLAEPALEASREGKVRFTPTHWTKVYEHWLENIRDWCISRQLWWGHRIPVWYCQNGACEEVIAAREDPTECPECGGTDLEQDPDVLDTWFSSWLWPFSTMGWPEETEDLEAFYPTNTLVTAPEILFFWVARMIMAGLEFMDEVPFDDVYLHGTVRDHLGRKMSKSLGNGIDPLDVVDEFGADALRYTIVAGAGVGADLYLNYEDLEATFAPGRNFANKLWNAGRFALMNLEGAEIQRVEDVTDSLDPADRWILSRLSKTTRKVSRYLETFRMHDAAEALYHFFWGEIADWYLELIKPRFEDDAEPESRDAAQATLVEVLDGVFRLLHPIMPFVSEALWQRLPAPEGVEREESLVIAAWPEPNADLEDDEAEARMDALMELIGDVRTLRAEYNVPPAERIEIRVTDVSDPLREAIEAERQALRRMAGVREVVYTDGQAEDEAGASAVLRSGGELFLPLAGVVDLERERERLAKELERMKSLLRSSETKLDNENFVTRAPAEVVERERAKAESFRDQQARILEKLTALA